MKAIISWVIAIIAAIIIVTILGKIFFAGMALAFSLLRIILFVIPVVIISLPLYIVIKKKFFKMK